MTPLPYNLMPLSFAVADFHLRAEQRIQFDKFPGFIIRSGFGAALKRLCLFKAKHIPCRDCYLMDRCPYSYIFETPNQDPSQDFTAENYPHPFVFYPQFCDQEIIESEQPFVLSITLFGEGIDYLMYYIYAFDLLGSMGLGRTRGNFNLESVRDHFTDELLYQESDKTLRGQLSRHTLQDFQQRNISQVTLNFVTPAKIEEKNRTIESMTSDILIRRLLRRGSLLAEQHEKTRWEIDFREIVDHFNAGVVVESSRLAVHRYERYSARQQREHPIYATTGKVTLAGALAAYLPLLQAGSYMHIGNSTSQGFGKYDLIFDERD